jgi:hypothetical protein
MSGTNQPPVSRPKSCRDAARVQFFRFHVPEGFETALVELRQASLESCGATYPGLRGAFLVRLENGDWLDIAVWDASDGEQGGTEFYPPVEARAEFFAEVDGLLGDETGVLIASSMGPSFPGPLGQRVP